MKILELFKVLPDGKVETHIKRIFTAEESYKMLEFLE